MHIGKSGYVHWAHMAQIRGAHVLGTSECWACALEVQACVLRSDHCTPRRGRLSTMSAARMFETLGMHTFRACAVPPLKTATLRDSEVHYASAKVCACTRQEVMRWGPAPVDVDPGDPPATHLVCIWDLDVYSFGTWRCHFLWPY